MKEIWKFINDVHEFSSLPPADIPEIVFWGRSNVGKSSLINSLTQSSIAKTSKTPGRTRSLVFFQLEKKLRIVDFPGYGFSKISKKIENKLDSLIDQYLQKRKCIEKLFLLIDSNLGFKETDKSGVPLIGSGDEDGFGKFQAGSIESSNTDVSNELTTMIKAQQLFSGASRLLQTEVEMVRSIMG